MTTVSIIIPVYNRAALLREAIDSVLPAANDIPLEIGSLRQQQCLQNRLTHAHAPSSEPPYAPASGRRK